MITVNRSSSTPKRSGFSFCFQRTASQSRIRHGIVEADSGTNYVRSWKTSWLIFRARSHTLDSSKARLTLQLC